MLGTNCVIEAERFKIYNADVYELWPEAGPLSTFLISSSRAISTLATAYMAYCASLLVTQQKLPAAEALTLTHMEEDKTGGWDNKKVFLAFTLTFIFYLMYLFETGSHCVTLADLEISMQTRN